MKGTPSIAAQRTNQRADALIADARKRAEALVAQNGAAVGLSEREAELDRQCALAATEAELLRGHVHILCRELSAITQAEHFKAGRYWTVRQTGGTGFEVVAEGEGRSHMVAHSYSRYHAELLAAGPRAMDLLQQFIDKAEDKDSDLVRAAQHCMYGPLSAKAGLEQIEREIRAAAPKVSEAA